MACGGAGRLGPKQRGQAGKGTEALLLLEPMRTKPLALPNARVHFSRFPQLAHGPYSRSLLRAGRKWGVWWDGVRWR